MRICPRCNNQIDDNTAFCPHCGAKANVQSTHQSTSATQMRLHCPRCKSTNLSAMTETVGSVGSATRVGKRSAIGSNTALRKRSWTCHQCGNIFRNVDDLEEEYETKYKTAMVIVVLAFGMMALFSLLMGALASNMGTAFILVFVYVGLIFLFNFVLKKWKVAKKKEVDQLRHDCFN